MTYWRQAGITYLRFSAISSQLVRAALKKEFRTEAPKKSTIKQTLWKDGKPIRYGAIKTLYMSAEKILEIKQMLTEGWESIKSYHNFKDLMYKDETRNDHPVKML